MIDLRHGDCLEVLRGMEADSVDSVVTDPPYGLSFMGKGWDYEVPTEDVWRECLRVLKSGGHLLAFAGTRTQHRMAVRIEDAGFEIRDMIAWVYGSGFPKSMDVSKAIDKATGAEREVVGTNPNYRPNSGAVADPKWFQDRSSGLQTTPATAAARQWDGWGTALKPALEPITVARKPLVGTVAANVLRHGTGAINVDGCRVGTVAPATTRGANALGRMNDDGWEPSDNGQRVDPHPAGRWPANLIHDGSEEVVGLFPKSVSRSSAAVHRSNGVLKHGGENSRPSHGTTERVTRNEGFNDSGSAARFFYCAKASKADRDEGLESFDRHVVRVTEGHGRGVVNTSKAGDGIRENRPRANIHPTVKPTALMRYLCRLVTPPNGIVLDPFMGSGSTGKAAILEGFRFVGIEREADYIEIARARIEAASARG